MTLLFDEIIYFNPEIIYVNTCIASVCNQFVYNFRLLSQQIIVIFETGFATNTVILISIANHLVAIQTVWYVLRQQLQRTIVVIKRYSYSMFIFLWQ